jgi:hypothetical protein
MNTLPRAITAQLFPNTESYVALKRHWSALVNSSRRHELTAAHHLLYAALMGKDWRKGFTPITNRRKLENGAYAGWKLFRAIQLLNPVYEPWLLRPFDGYVTAPMFERIREMISRASPYAYRPEDFAAGRFPFDAYRVPEALLTTAPRTERAHA